MRPKINRRSGIGERAPYILTFMIIFQLSGGAANTMNMFTYQQNVQTGPFSPSTIASAFNCSTFTAGTNQGGCTPNIGAAQSQPNLLVFGDWFRALTIIGQFFEGMALPGFFAIQFGLPVIWAGVLTGGAWVCWLFLYLWLLSGRPL